MINPVKKNICDISDWVSLRHNPQALRFNGCGPSASFDLFDWVIWLPFDKELTKFEVEQPKTILCLPTPESVNFLLEKVNFDSQPSVVFAGKDTVFSALQDVIHQKAGLFSKILYEAKDIDSNVVKSFSMGFISFYLRDSGYENIYKAIEYSNQVPKSSLVLAAWGERWRYLDGVIEDRKLLDEFLQNHSFLKDGNSFPLSNIGKNWQNISSPWHHEGKVFRHQS